MHRVEFLIVGQGLAGTAISWQLHQQGRSFKIIDQFNPDSPSRVAAGLINPVTGRNLNPTWNIDQLLPAAMDQYRAMDQFLGIQSLHEMPVWRFFHRHGEREKFKDQIDKTPKWLSNIPSDCKLPGLAISANGGIMQGGGWLDTELLLNAWRKHLYETDRITDDLFVWKDLEVQNNTIKYRETEANHLIVATGYLPPDHPLFPDLPFSPTKGEILTVKGPDWPQDRIYMYQYFLVPLSNGTWRLGATYNWKNLDNEPTQEAAGIMLKRWGEAFSGEFTVIDHRAGVRPSTTDRMPLVGTHHTYCNIHLLSGLGSKGAVLAPWITNILIPSADKNGALPNEIRWDRKHQKHQSSKNR